MTTIGTNISNNWEVQQTQQPTPAGGTSSVSNIPMVDNSGGTENIPFSSQTSTPSSTSQTKRSITQLRDAIAGILKEHGIEPNEAMKTGMLEKVSGQRTEYLLNANETELNHFIKCLKLALEHTPKKADGSADIDAIVKRGNDYHVALKTGWAEEDLKNIQNGKSVLDKLKDFYPNRDLRNPDILKQSFKDYINWVFNEAKADTIKDRHKLEIQEFGKLLINTPDEEKGVFLDVLKELHQANKLTGIEALMESVQSIENRTELADQAGDPKYLQELLNGKDADGAELTTAQKTEIVDAIASRQSEEGLTESHKVAEDLKTAFETANAEALKVLEEKLAEIEKMDISDEEKAKLIKERLSEEEKKLLAEKEFYRALTSGHMTGTANNSNISEEAKGVLLHRFHFDAYQHEDYQEVMEQIADFVKEHAENFNMPVEEFEKLLNEATNGNYDTVAKNLDRDLVSPILEEVQPITTTANVENSIGVEITAPTLNEQQKKQIEKTVDNIQKQTQREAKIIANKEGAEIGSSAAAQVLIANRNKLVIGILAKSGYSFEETLSKTGCSVKEGIAYACENHKDLPRAFVDRAKKTFKDFTDDDQVDFIVNHGTFAFDLLFKEMSDDAIFKLENEKDGMLQDLKDKIDRVAEQRRKELNKANV